MENEIMIPIMVTSDQPSERMERVVRGKLTDISKYGKGKFKIRTASGCFNKFIMAKKLKNE